MAKRILIDEKEVDNYFTIHPALDFYDGKALVAIGTKMQRTYEIEVEGNNDNKSNKKTKTEVEFDNRPIIVTSDYEKFVYSKLQLAKRSLFYTGSTIDPIYGRWSREDIDDFLVTHKSPNWAEAYDIVKSQFTHYLDFIDDRLYVIFPIFVIYSYFYPIFNGAPILHLWGEFRTGKTKICSLFECMCFNPINSANISSATVFRVIEGRRATVILDENEETGSERAKEIKNMLLAGTGKSGVTYRQEKQFNDSFKTQSYKVFSPKVIANITGIDVPALASRTIRITTVGGTDEVRMNAEVDIENNDYWQPVRANLYRLCLVRYKDVFAIKDKIFETDELTGRTLSIWKGMLSIALLIGADTYNACLEYARDNKEFIEGETEDAEERPRKLIATLLQSMNGVNPDKVSSDNLYNLLSSIGFSSKTDMSRALARIGIKNRPLRNDDGALERFYILDRDYLEKIVQRK